MPLVKFLKREHKDRILKDQTLLIRKAKYYRDHYEVTRSKWIDDPMEGVSVATLTHFSEGTWSTTEQRAARKVGIEIIDCFGGAIVDSWGSSVDDTSFIFCVSRGDPEALKKVWYHPSEFNLDPYDACLMIRDERQFIRALKYSYFGGTTTADKIGPLRVEFTRRFRDVRYTDQPRNALTEDHDILTKDPCFAPQAEARLIFRPLESVTVDSLLIRAPGNGAPALRDCFIDIS